MREPTDRIPARFAGIRRAAARETNPMKKSARSPGALLAALLAPLTGCASHPDLPTVPSVDLERFMGNWYVLAHVPASSEEDAHNAIESYSLGEDGRIETTYAFRKGSTDGPIEVMRPVGFVEDTTTNATWGMRFFWPIKAEYLITYLDADYTRTIVGRTKRDYAWIMARTPELPEGELEALEKELENQGYDLSKVRRVPQKWPDPEHPLAPTSGD